MTGDWQDAIDRAQANAPFLAGALVRMPEIAGLLGEGKGDEALSFAKLQRSEVEDTGTVLRRERLGIALALAVGDLAGAFSLERVMYELSDLADRALDTAIRDTIGQRTGEPTGDGFIALALGKHGAHELNYSSDIDPILLYDPDILPRRERDEPGEAAQRYARHVVRSLSENTAEGYVFRVDLRLRPASEVSPLAISCDAALSHYESSALAWERAAYIRARACAGDIMAGENFLSAIRPFVWRRSLDFGAIEEIGRLTARIRETYSGPGEPGPGFNVKQGRGGIREVEFFAQTHQLIHGGRDPTLRLRGTRAALDALAVAGIVETEDARVLGESYDRLRTVEHRLQMIEDQQTHSLPDGEALDRVARLDGLADGAALIAELREVTDAVAHRFDRLIDEEGKTVAAVPSGGLAARLDSARLRRSGKPRQAYRRMERWPYQGLAQFLGSGRFRRSASAIARSVGRGSRTPIAPCCAGSACSKRRRARSTCSACSMHARRCSTSSSISSLSLRRWLTSWAGGPNCSTR